MVRILPVGSTPTGFLLNQPIALESVINGPERLKIGVVESKPLLRGVRKVKAGNWCFVINVPKVTVSPRHARSK